MTEGLRWVARVISSIDYGQYITAIMPSASQLEIYSRAF